jgi:hypothetical protein
VVDIGPTDLTRAAALAAAIKALTSGPAHVLAAELVDVLEGAREGGDVVSLAEQREKRRE